MPAYDLPPPLDAQKALDIIAHKVTMTPMKTSTHLNRLATVNARQTHGDSSMPAIQLFLKCENLQKTGSFKYRGATHFLAKLQDQELANGVVAYSTGEYQSQTQHKKSNTYLHLNRQSCTSSSASSTSCIPRAQHAHPSIRGSADRLSSNEARRCTILRCKSTARRRRRRTRWSSDRDQRVDRRHSHPASRPR